MYTYAKDFFFCLSCVDGLFMGNPVDNGSVLHGAKRNCVLYHRNFAAVCFLCSGICDLVMVRNVLSAKCVESSENNFCDCDDADGTAPGSLCKSGVVKNDIWIKKRTEKQGKIGRDENPIFPCFSV